MNHLKHWMFALALTVLSGCGLYEAVAGIPMATVYLVAPDRTTTARVFQCAETTVKNLAVRDSFWRSDVTRRDVARSILETGDFDKANVGGFRAKVAFDQKALKVRLDVKGAGAYYKDIGVQKAAADLKDGMESCLQKLPVAA